MNTNAVIDSRLNNRVTTAAYNPTKAVYNGTSTVTPTPTQARPPEAGIGFFIDVEGKINFKDSACNDLRYSGTGSADLKVLPKQVLFKSETGEFSGVLALVETDGLKGTYFAPQEAFFKQQKYCAPSLNDYSRQFIDKFLPTDKEVQDMLANQYSESDDDIERQSSENWENKYRKVEKSRDIAIAFSVVEAVAIAGLTGFMVYQRQQLRKKALLPNEGED